ncbi:MAG TPA: hypothetical protein VF292_05290, partial [Rhodanobacteraceae bacterium]
PDHPLLTTLLRGGYAAAAALETGERLASGLPPFGYLALLRAECRERSVLDAFMAAARRAIGQDVRFAANDDALTDNGSAALGAEEPSPSIPLPAEGGGVLTRASEGGDGSPPSTGRGSTHSVGGMLADARNPSPSIPLSTEGGGVPTRAAEGGGVPTHPAEGRRGSPPSAGRGSARSAGGMPQPYANAVRVSGPFDAPMPLRAGRHRAQLLIEAAQRPRLRQVLDAWLPRLRALPQPRGLRWSIDIDPVDLY